MIYELSVFSLSKTLYEDFVFVKLKNVLYFINTLHSDCVWLPESIMSSSWLFISTLITGGDNKEKLLSLKWWEKAYLCGIPKVMTAFCGRHGKGAKDMEFDSM